MIVYVPLFAFCIVFLELFIRLGIVKDALAIVSGCREAMGVLMSRVLADEEKEAFMRHSAVEIFQATLRFALKFIAVSAVLVLLYLSCVAIFPGLRESLLETAMTPAAIVSLTLGSMAYAWARKALLRRR